jgi:hypothetical protein
MLVAHAAGIIDAHMQLGITPVIGPLAMLHDGRAFTVGTGI